MDSFSSVIVSLKSGLAKWIAKGVDSLKSGLAEWIVRGVDRQSG